MGLALLVRFRMLDRSFHYDYEIDTVVNKNSPPGLDQLWPHVFCQFRVADHGVLSIFSSVFCRVGLSGVAGTSANGTAAGQVYTRSSKLRWSF